MSLVYEVGPEAFLFLLSSSHSSSSAFIVHVFAASPSKLAIVRLLMGFFGLVSLGRQLLSSKLLKSSALFTLWLKTGITSSFGVLSKSSNETSLEPRFSNFF